LVADNRGSVADSYALGAVVYSLGAPVLAAGQFGGLFGQDLTSTLCGTIERVYGGSTSVNLSLARGGLPFVTGSGALSGEANLTYIGGGRFLNSYYWSEPANPGVVPDWDVGVYDCINCPINYSGGGWDFVGISGLSDLTNASGFAGFDFTSGGPWRMPTANPLAPTPPGGTGPLLSPVLAWQCGHNGVVCN